eukprot:CAMPEP_0198423270 /NCGR_PEP_ID=MMETSP1452-20131203/2994_1 /TAXON_ID=1181717 /ORGANISM="Synchroma pusillum, Strain CCMP3072" /LENGTH=65 /DNA_ID=CAMNT_0044143567 /DNA_START=1 /DNA_END=195 /DNA_ORIENTATION=-
MPPPAAGPAALRHVSPWSVNAPPPSPRAFARVWGSFADFARLPPPPAGTHLLHLCLRHALVFSVW